MPAQEIWTWHQVTQGNRFDAFAGALKRAHFEWDLGSPYADDFRANVHRRLYRDVILTEVKVLSLHGARTAPIVRRSSADHISVQCLLKGKKILRQNGNTCEMTPGDVAVWDATRPAEFHCPEDLHQLAVLVPKSMLSALVPGLEEACAQKISAQSGMGAMLSAHMRLLHEQMDRVRCETQPALVRATVELLATALNSELGLDSPRSLRADLLAQVKAYIRDHLTDPDLTPAHVAKAFAITPRYLHRLFEDTDRTAGEWIRELRLERARTDLSDPLCANQSVTDIALRSGFNSATHFSQVFRARHGTSPSAYRAKALNPAADN